MYYRSGTDILCCIDAGRRFVFTHQVAALFCVKLRHGHDLLRMTLSEIRLRQSMRIYLKNNLAKFCPDMI